MQILPIAAFENSDHENTTLLGIKENHDTVSVLFQKKPQRTSNKPNISVTGIVRGSIIFQQNLKCQVIQSCIKPAKKPGLPPDYSPSIQTNYQELNMKGC